MSGDGMNPPFKWFGGKRRVAGEVWRRFGAVSTYIEPFFGSGAVLLGAPAPSKLEVVNDKDCLVANFWRAAQNAPEELARLAADPVNEAEHTARHVYVCEHMDDLQPRIMADVSYYDVTVAGYWMYSIRRWIGSGYASGDGAWGVRTDPDGTRVLVRAKENPGVKGIIIRQRPGKGAVPTREEVFAGISALSRRLARVLVLCGDWSRAVTPVNFPASGVGGVFLDPPYSSARNITYREDGDLREGIMRWCRENGGREDRRIAVCGYDGEYNELQNSGWTTHAWKASGGFSKLSGGQNENSSKERIWFSPHCLPEVTPGLFCGRA